MSSGADEIPDEQEPTNEEASRLEALLRVVQGSITACTQDEILNDRRLWLERSGLEKADVDAMASLGDQRLLVYRNLVRRGLKSAIDAEIPRTAARLGALFDVYLNRFFEQELPRSHYLRDVAFEFVTYAAPLWMDDPAVPDFLPDLARHELVAFEVAGVNERLADRTGPEVASQGDDLSPDTSLRFDSAVKLVRYDYAIHRLKADLAARDTPDKQPTALLVYRDAEHEVRYLELSPLAAAIVDLLLVGDTLRQAVINGCAAIGQPMDAAVLEGTVTLLDDLAQRGILLGVAQGEVPRQ